MTGPRIRYERVRIGGPGVEPRTLLLQVLSESDAFLLGIEVDLEGDEVTSPGCDERRHLIDKAAVRRRTPLVMDRLYGVLVEPGNREAPQ